MLHTPVTRAPRCRASWTAAVPTPAGGADDQHLLSALEPGLPEEAQRGGPAEGQGRRLLVAEAGRLERHGLVLPAVPLLREAPVLGVAAQARPGEAEDLVAHLEPRDRPSGRLDLAGELRAEDRLARPGEAERQPREEPEALRDLEAADPPVAGGDGRRSDPDEDLVVPGHRLRNLLSVSTSGGPNRSYV